MTVDVSALQLEIHYIFYSFILFMSFNWRRMTIQHMIKTKLLQLFSHETSICRFFLFVSSCSLFYCKFLFIYHMVHLLNDLSQKKRNLIRLCKRYKQKIKTQLVSPWFSNDRWLQTISMSPIFLLVSSWWCKTRRRYVCVLFVHIDRQALFLIEREKR